MESHCADDSTSSSDVYDMGRMDSMTSAIIRDLEKVSHYEKETKLKTDASEEMRVRIIMDKKKKAGLFGKVGGGLGRALGLGTINKYLHD